MCCFVIQLSVFAMQTCSLRDAHDIIKELEEKLLKIQLTYVFRKTRFGKKGEKNNSIQFYSKIHAMKVFEDFISRFLFFTEVRTRQLL